MLNKIKDLKRQAWGLAEKDSVDEFGIPDELKKKSLFGDHFARLLINDCLQACENIAVANQQLDGSFYAGKKAGAFECSEALKAYLGKS